MTITPSARTAARSGRPASRPTGARGFSLVEVLLALSIIGVLSLIALATFGRDRASAEVSLSASKRSVQMAAETALAQNGSYPATLGAMVEDGFLDDPSNAIQVPAGGTFRSATLMSTKSWSLVYGLNDDGTYTIETGAGIQKPGKPLNVIGVAANGAVTVSWDAPATDGGSEITKYTVLASPGNAACTATEGARACVVPGLTNNVAYTFKVRATNIIGDGPESAASAAVVPQGAEDVPGAPRLTGARGNASATITIQPPAVDGGSPITGYTVTRSGSGSGTGTAATTCTTTTLTCQFTSLTNGTAYTFTAYATNVHGNGPSFPAISVTPATNPSTPVLSSTGTVPNDGAIRVTWTAQTSTSTNGGDAVTGYTATTDSGATCTASGASSTTCTITGLTNGQAYNVSVKSTNSVGPSAASAALSVTPNGCTIRSLSAPTSLMQRSSTNTAAQTNAAFTLSVKTVGNCVGTVTVVFRDATGTPLVGASTQTVSITSTNTTTEVTTSKSVAANTITVGIRTNPGTISALLTHPTASSVTVSGLRVVQFSSGSS